ncbi:MAG TPA: SMP-30/gluconolactonase/LRE family protein [Pseudosphingobacterium sp.]|nr:SMP-30/gluconolactonase/LRE family protein [Pseudosphingobacterium sp.]
MNHFIISIALLFLSSQRSLVAPEAKLELIAQDFAFTEGPAADRKGNVYFTDQPNNKIWKYSTNGKLSVYMDKAGRSNGLYFDKQENLIACADENNQLWSIKNGKIEKLVLNYQDTLLNGPNDVWVAPNGNIYFTDPYYQRDYWIRKKPDLNIQALYLYDRRGKLVRLDSSFKQPNGIIGTPDGKWLYVADIGGNKTYRYAITKDGLLSDKQLFVDQGSDGMTLDNEGNLYLTGNGITIYNNKGKKIEYIAIPAKWTGNVCFAGSEKNLLFITASDKIFTLKMRVKGVD